MFSLDAFYIFLCWGACTLCHLYVIYRFMLMVGSTTTTAFLCFYIKDFYGTLPLHFVSAWYNFVNLYSWLVVLLLLLPLYLTTATISYYYYHIVDSYGTLASHFVSPQYNLQIYIHSWPLPLLLLYPATTAILKTLMGLWPCTTTTIFIVGCTTGLPVLYVLLLSWYPTWPLHIAVSCFFHYY